MPQGLRAGMAKAPLTIAALPLAVSLLLSVSAALLLSGCAGVGNYVRSTINPFGDPNAPKGYALNMERARGHDVPVAPILPQAGDIWPGKVRPVPTLSDIQQHMNVPLSQEYQDQYGNGSAPRAASGATASRSGRYGRAHSSTPPGSVQSPVPSEPAIPATPPTPAHVIGSHRNFAVGQTLMGPGGPAGVVTGSSNGRYQTVAPIDGAGGGILIPNGNGTATLIQPDGQAVTVQGQGQSQGQGR